MSGGAYMAPGIDIPGTYCSHQYFRRNGTAFAVLPHGLASFGRFSTTRASLTVHVASGALL